MIIGGDDITPDSKVKKENCVEYKFAWFTNGYAATTNGKRHELHIVFVFDSAKLVTNFQVKFYPITKSSHLTWGTEIHRIELEGRGNLDGAGAAGFESLVPTNIKFV